jgi:hypothetical protein
MAKQQSESDTPLSLEEVYQGLDIDNNVWTEVDSHCSLTTVIGKDFENGLKRIHSFVNRVNTSDAPAYRITFQPSGRIEAHGTRLGSIPTSAFITPEFRQAYEVSEQVRVFLEAEEDLHVQQEHPWSEPLRESWTQPGKLVADVANEFVQLIRKKTSRKDFRRRFADRKFGVQENFKKGQALIDALFRRYARLAVIRIDFNYRTEHPTSLEQTKKDLDRLLNNGRNTEIFHTVVGYIWHLEWAFLSGWHWHVMFFLDGSKTWKDTYVAHQMGKYWEGPITEGRGRHHNCNADKNKYKRIGIGMISHDDADKRDVLVNVVLRYLTKVDELARPRLRAGTKTFGTSQMPEPHPGTGRKRRPCE